MHQDKLRTQTSQIHSLALAPCMRTEIKKNKETLDFKGKQTLWGVSNIQPEGRSRRKIKEVIIFGFLSWPRRQGAMPKLSFSYDGNISLQTTRKWKKRQWNPTHLFQPCHHGSDWLDWFNTNENIPTVLVFLYTYSVLSSGFTGLALSDTLQRNLPWGQSLQLYTQNRWAQKAEQVTY